MLQKIQVVVGKVRNGLLTGHVWMNNIPDWYLLEWKFVDWNVHTQIWNLEAGKCCQIVKMLLNVLLGVRLLGCRARVSAVVVVRREAASASGVLARM